MASDHEKSRATIKEHDKYIMNTYSNYSRTSGVNALYFKGAGNLSFSVSQNTKWSCKLNSDRASSPMHVGFTMLQIIKFNLKDNLYILRGSYLAD